MEPVANRRRQWLRRAAAAAALAVLGLAAGLLVAEGLLAAFHPQVYRRPRVWQYDAQLGWRHIPGASGRLISPEFDVEVRMNPAGLRERPVSQQAAPGVERILVFGDSFVEGWGVEVEQCLSRRLEAAVNSGPERRVEVLNFGVAGYGTDQELLFFDDLGRHYGPDQVVVLFYGNDLWNNASPRGLGAERGHKPYFRPAGDGHLVLRGVPVPRSRFWDEARPAASQPLARYLAERWHLFALGRHALAPEVTRGEQSSFYGGLYGLDPAGRFAPVWDLTGRLLAEFAARIRREGARPLVVYAPAIVQVERANWRAKQELYGLVGQYDLDKPNRQLAALAAKNGIPFFDLGPVFARAPAEPRLYYRDSHWTPAGHDLAARAVAGALAPERAPAGAGRSGP